MKLWHQFAILDLILLMVIGKFIINMNYNHPEEFQIKNFPLLQQSDNITCGPTSCTMLLKYYGRNVGIEEIKYKTKTTWFTYKNKAVGLTVPEYIKFTLEEYQLDATLKTGTVDEIKYYVSKNRPPIVLLRSGKALWHWVVVIGFDKEILITADPGSGKVEIISQKNFEGAWDYSHDMQGNYMGRDIYRFLLQMVDVSGNVLVVPDFPAG